MLKNLFSIIILSLLPISHVSAASNNLDAGLKSAEAGKSYVVELGGNAFVVKGNGANIDNKYGLLNWRDADSVIATYFRVQEAQKNATLSLNARGHSKICVSVGGKSAEVELNSDDFKDYEVGKFDFSAPGYQKITIQGREKSGETFGEVKTISLQNIIGKVNYVNNSEHYWGRRGPSVNMMYRFPKNTKIEYFYSEITVPEGEDAMHSYFMLNGFAQGYFGIQVNSPTERRVLFSVWSPFSTHNPKDIPQDQRIIKLRQGKDVHIGEFGNEGSGGQSFLRYMWKAGQTYKVINRVRPDGKGNTDYTAYFYMPEEKQWRLIASFRRPKTNTWYEFPHSFLENFNPNQGWIEREVFFGNQWACDNTGKWHEITQANFGCDGTGSSKIRMDYTGGISPDGKGFFLRNCGFFNENTRLGVLFERKSSGNPPPNIDFEALEKL